MATFREVASQVTNWGRWGPDDERGTVNHVTPERLVAAAHLVRQGKVFDLGIPLDGDGPQPGGSRINPVRLMSATGADQPFPGAFRYADDYVFMPLQAASQWDSLAHVFYDGHMYNGYPTSDVGPYGAAHNSIDKMAKGIAGRGVLLDIARLKGVDWLEKGQVITPGDLEEAEAAQGVRVGPGDILLFRTGWRKLYLQTGDRMAFMSGEPGIGLDCVPWLAEREVAAIGSDNFAIEAIPGDPGGELLQVHMVLIRDMGMTLGEILDFEELADDCAVDGVWEFFFCAPPLKFTKGVGSPINPLALK
jgi:kynurenine formamidase